MVLAALSGCGDPCVRACRHVFDDCALSTASSEAACEQSCSTGTGASLVCASPGALQDCYSSASCEALKSGAAATECQSACGS